MCNQVTFLTELDVQLSMQGWKQFCRSLKTHNTIIICSYSAGRELWLSEFTTGAAAMSACEACVQSSIWADSASKRLLQKHDGKLQGTVIWQQPDKAVVSSTHVNRYCRSFNFII